MRDLTSVFVGTVNESSARLWLRTKLAGPFTLELSSGREKQSKYATISDRRSADSDCTMAFSIPEDTAAVGQLSPASEYHFRVTVSATGELIGEGRFETAPPAETKDDFAFAFMSCHQPYASEESLHPDSLRMMSILEPVLTIRRVKYLLLTGDQIYADAPGRLSITKQAAGSEEETVWDIRFRYQAQYRLFWSFPEMQKLQSNFPTWCIWDDHEIVNDWGTRKEHLEPYWQKTFEGAKRAFADYQVSRNLPVTSSLPASFHQSFVWGQTATFIFDLHSERFFDGHVSRIYGEEQLKALNLFLKENENQPILFIVLTIPLVYFPDWFVKLGERVPKYGKIFATRWNAAQNRKSLEKLLSVFQKHQRNNPRQKLILLSGDVHQSSALKLVWQSGERAYQFVSSPVTNAERNWRQKIAHQLAFSMSGIQYGNQQIFIERLKPELARQHNPFNGLNIGVVHVRNDDAGEKVRFEIISYDAAAAREMVAFDSGWL
jgi:alkaline phosphatase D